MIIDRINILMVGKISLTIRQEEQASRHSLVLNIIHEESLRKVMIWKLMALETEINHPSRWLIIGSLVMSEDIWCHNPRAPALGYSSPHVCISYIHLRSWTKHQARDMLQRTGNFDLFLESGKILMLFDGN